MPGSVLHVLLVSPTQATMSLVQEQYLDTSHVMDVYTVNCILQSLSSKYTYQMQGGTIYQGNTRLYKLTIEVIPIIGEFIEFSTAFTAGQEH